MSRSHLEALMQERGVRLQMFWNNAGQCFTVQAVDRAGRAWPPQGQGDWLATGKPRLVDALTEIATDALRYRVKP